jgi:hypothetical protein
MAARWFHRSAIVGWQTSYPCGPAIAAECRPPSRPLSSARFRRCEFAVGRAHFGENLRALHGEMLAQFGIFQRLGDGRLGLGEEFDGDKVKAYPPGSVIVSPGDTFHFHWAKSGDYVTQVTAIGPLGLEYLDPHDDPRHK